jgi:hypothetical protein
VIVTVAKAAGPVPKDPRSQSSVPPVAGPTSTHTPRVDEKPVIVKTAGGVAGGASIIRTNWAPAEPRFLISMV